MSEEQEKLGFREWTVHYEREQEADRDKINTLTDAISSINSNVGALTANVQTLMDNQKSMFQRINRPANWGIFGTFAAVIFMVVGLVVSDLKDNIDSIETHQALDIERNMTLHMWFRDEIAKNSVEAAAHAVDIEWIKKLEERMNGRIHERLK